MGRNALIVIGSGFQDCPERVPGSFDVLFETLTLLFSSALHSFHIEAVGDCLHFGRGREGIRIVVWRLRFFFSCEPDSSPGENELTELESVDLGGRRKELQMSADPSRKSRLTFKGTL